MKIIDFEYHCYIPEVLEAMSKRKTLPIYYKDINTVQWTETISQPHEPMKRRLERSAWPQWKPTASPPPF